MFEPGASVEVTWVETTNHRSYYRVAFDVDGDDDFPSFLGNGVGTEGIDPRALCPVDGQVILAYDMEDRSGGSHTLSVRLPDVECERCTLQVIQFMYDTGRPYYYQCADLALRRSPRRDLAPDAGGVPDAGSATSASDASAAASDGDRASGPAPRDPRAAPGCWSRIAPDERRGPPGAMTMTMTMLTRHRPRLRRAPAARAAAVSRRRRSSAAPMGVARFVRPAPSRAAPALARVRALVRGSPRSACGPSRAGAAREENTRRPRAARNGRQPLTRSLLLGRR